MRVSSLFALFLFTRAVAEAQLVRGTVRDAATGGPVETADVALLVADDSVVARTLTGADGSFEIRPPRAGMYRLRVARLGYATRTTAELAIPAGRDTTFHLRLQPSPESLEPVEVVTSQDARLRRVGFYRRLERGIGYFRTPPDLAELRPIFPADLFHGLPGIRVLADGNVVTTAFGRSCPLTIALDRTILARDATGNSNWSEMVHVNDVHAVEVYTRPTGLPPWLAGSVSGCGAIVIWTK